MSRVQINGRTYSQDDKYGAHIEVLTPDGETTTLDSEAIFLTADSAKCELENKLAELLRELHKQGIEVVSRDGITYQ